jgi:outer membrane protein OmpA-like peptidoglycan-associated protein
LTLGSLAEDLSMKTVASFLSLLGLCFFSLLALAAGDVKGSADHPLLSRFPGAVIVQYLQAAYDEYELPLGKHLGKKQGFERSQKVAGKVTKLEYVVPAGHSVLEVFENYREAIANAGFEPLYTCVNKPDCGGDLGEYMGASWYSDSRYLAAKGGDQAAPTYVALFVHKRGSAPEIGVFQNIIESKPMKTGQVTAGSAADISRALDAQGKFALYGLYFDTGKAVLKPESDAALEQVALVLKGSPSLALFVVGHTDSTGQVAANVDLSERRAEAAVKALVDRYGIAANRLTAKGVGPFAPVGPNRTEDGRAKNRRVELVEQ